MLYLQDCAEQAGQESGSLTHLQILVRASAGVLTDSLM
ncbi:hypothetical protein ACNKHM_09125 [Shigella sonnei]